MDDELRRLTRARDLSPDDPGAARRVASLATRRGDRTLAADSWQEVLRRAPRDDEAEQRLAEVGCELVFSRRDEQGLDEFRNVIDGALLVRAPALPDAFVARQPVTYEQFHRFLSREGGRPESTKWIAARGPLRRTALGPWSLRGGEATSESYVQEISWLGARAYAVWAGGRLLTASEWERLAEAPTAVEGFDRNEGEWVDGLRGPHERPIMTLWDPRWPSAAAHLVQWEHEDACPPVLFRYARDSWFRGDLA